VLYANTEQELYAAMSAIAEKPELAAEYQTRGVARARSFSWDHTARATYEIYQEARRRFGT
jgi:glycosyltransferase involved in cell wall biosynthesis